MISILLSCLLAQLTYEEGKPVKIDAPAFDFERVIPTADGFLISDQEHLVVLVCDINGKVRAKLGSGGAEEALQLPGYATFMPKLGLYYVYDASRRDISVWDKQFKFVRKIQTEFPLFFEIRHLLDMGDSIAAATTVTEGRYLVTRYDGGFKSPLRGYELSDRDLADLSPELSRTFISRSDMYGGTRILAAQALSNSIAVMDGDLNRVQQVPLNIPGWREPKMKRLKKVSKNPRELDKYRSNFSEIIALQSLDGSLFVVGLRNVLGGIGYYFQCFDASTGAAVGTTYNTALRPLGSGHSRIYLRGSDRMTLQPVYIR